MAIWHRKIKIQKDKLNLHFKTVHWSTTAEKTTPRSTPKHCQRDSCSVSAAFALNSDHHVLTAGIKKGEHLQQTVLLRKGEKSPSPSRRNNHTQCCLFRPISHSFTFHIISSHSKVILNWFWWFLLNVHCVHSWQPIGGVQWPIVTHN